MIHGPMCRKFPPPVKRKGPTPQKGRLIIPTTKTAHISLSLEPQLKHDFQYACRVIDHSSMTGMLTRMIKAYVMRKSDV